MFELDQKTVGRFTAKWGVDPDPFIGSPRDDENIGTFFGFHRRYRSPDAAPDADPQTAAHIATRSQNICLPVWLYDHSGTAYRAAEANPFHCPWDSGLFGFIYVSKADARKAFGVSRLTAATIEKVKAALRAEVEAYSAWANGEVYMWSVENEDGDTLDSVGGYIGDVECAKAEAIATAEHFNTCEALAA
jgi:hypothetical protein